MAIASNVTPETPPAYKRVRVIVIDNGVQGLDAQGAPIFVTPAFVEIAVAGCDPALGLDGVQLKNVFGEPVWLDKPGWVGSKRITDPALLQAYLAIWGQLMALAETEAASITMASS